MILLYIDPGTGSMLFTVLIGIFATAGFFFRKLFIRLKFLASGGRVKDTSLENIPYLIFSDSRIYWTTFKPILDEFEKRGVDAVYWTASPDDPILEAEYSHIQREFIGEGNKAFARLNMMRADICFSTTPSLDVFFWKRSKNVKYYVHVLHAQRTSLGYRMFGVDFYDAILLSGEFQIHEQRELERLRGLPAKELVVVGCPYMDRLKERLDAEGRDIPGKNGTTILIAPSWGYTSLLRKHGEKLLEILTDTGYDLIVRPHPQSQVSDRDVLEQLMKKYPENEHLTWDFEADNFDSLRKADVMISDFSGVMFDFACIFEKPLIYTENTFDDSQYDSCWLEEGTWQFQILPEIGMPLKEEELSSLKDSIDTLLTDDARREGIKKCREACWQHIGESSARIVDYLIKKEEELTAKKDAARASGSLTASFDQS